MAGRAAEEVSDPAPASQSCAAAPEWSDSCHRHGLFDRGTPPFLNPNTEGTGDTDDTDNGHFFDCLQWGITIKVGNVLIPRQEVCDVT